jgi:hypothetical protein
MSVYFPSAISKHLPLQRIDTLGLFNTTEITSISEAQRIDNPRKLFKDTFFYGYNTDPVRNWVFLPHPLARQNELSYS